MSRDWEDLFPTVSINMLPREISDHNPLIMCTDMSKPLNHLSFNFEKAWLVQDDFKEKVKSIWDEPCFGESAFDRIQSKLKRLSNISKDGALTSKGLELEEEEETDLLTYNQLHLRISLTSELLRILEEEELFWFKRRHETWLHKGDLNTDYFHKVANGRKRKNIIFSLVDENQVIQGDKELLEHATNYYKKAFWTCRNHKNSTKPQHIPKCRKTI